MMGDRYRYSPATSLGAPERSSLWTTSQLAVRPGREDAGARPERLGDRPQTGRGSFWWARLGRHRTSVLDSTGSRASRCRAVRSNVSEFKPFCTTVRIVPREGVPLQCRRFAHHCNSRVSDVRGGPGEAHLPTQQPQAQAQARFSPANADARGSVHHRSTTRERPQAPLGVIWRVRSAAEFAALAGSPPRRSRYFVVHVTRLADDGPPRLAFAVSRRFGSAPARNRIRRRIRAAAADLPLEPGMGYLVRVQPGADRLPFTRLVDDLAALSGSRS